MSAQMESARGQSCTLRYFGRHCRGDVVACHVKPRGHGSVGKKPHDVFSVYGCQRCHDVVDRRGHEWLQVRPDIYWEVILRALVETITIKMQEGLVEAKL